VDRIASQAAITAKKMSLASLSSVGSAASCSWDCRPSWCRRWPPTRWAMAVWAAAFVGLLPVGALTAGLAGWLGAGVRSWSTRS